MLGKIVKVGVDPKDGLHKVKSVVVGKDGSSSERTNLIDPSAVAAVTALVGQNINLQLSKDGTYTVIGVGDYEKPASKGGFGKKGGGFTKAADDPAKQEMIVKQNALGHATAIAIHNAQGSVISVDRVIQLAQPLVDFVMASAKKTTIVGSTVTPVVTKTVAVEDDF